VDDPPEEEQQQRGQHEAAQDRREGAHLHRGSIADGDPALGANHVDQGRWVEERLVRRDGGPRTETVPRPHRLATMADLTRDDVAHLAGLARIDLTDAELDRMVGELGAILEAVATVQQAPIVDVEPMSHPMPLVNVTRPDVVRPSLSPEEALAAAPEAEQQRFSVPRILDDE
jgi:aspartyl-tRNA(Asn)/glutamyl-tRNA(Gln) amidotransferase subunit C